MIVDTLFTTSSSKILTVKVLSSYFWKETSLKQSTTLVHGHVIFNKRQFTTLKWLLCLVECAQTIRHAYRHYIILLHVIYIYENVRLALQRSCVLLFIT